VDISIETPTANASLDIAFILSSQKGGHAAKAAIFVLRAKPPRSNAQP
jgi:hypothetical protein